MLLNYSPYQLNEENYYSIEYDMAISRLVTIDAGLYGLWCPVHLEPIFQNMNFYGARETIRHYS